MDNIKSKIFRGVSWRLIIDISGQVFQVVFTAILARLLTRDAFGLVAMALLGVRFIQMMASFGVGSIIIQNKNITQSQISAFFLIEITLKLLLTVLSFHFSYLVADFFNEPQLTSIFQALSLLLIINSLTFPDIVLRKSMKFAGQSVLELCSNFTGNIVGIILAYSGYGVWSLVFKQITSKTIYSISIWFIAGWFPKAPSFRGIGKMLNFGYKLFLANTISFFNQELVSLVIGKFFGAEKLGVYNIAYNLALLPANKMKNIIASVLTPAFSSINDNSGRFKENFESVFFLISSIFIPFMLGISVVSNIFVILVYGSKWQLAGTFLFLLSFSGLLQGLIHIMNTVIISRGWGTAIVILTVLEITTKPVLIYFGGKYFGVMGLILANLTTGIIMVAFVIRYTEKCFSGANTVLSTISKPVFSSIAMFIVGVSISKTFLAASVLNFILLTSLCVLTYILVFFNIVGEKERNWLNRLPYAKNILKYF